MRLRRAVGAKSTAKLCVQRMRRLRILGPPGAICELPIATPVVCFVRVRSHIRMPPECGLILLFQLDFVNPEPMKIPFRPVNKRQCR